MSVFSVYHDASAEESAPPRVLVVVLPIGSAEHGRLAERLEDAVVAAGLEAIDGSALRVGLPDEVAAEVSRLEETARQRELALELTGALEARHAVVEALEGTLEAAVSPSRLAAALAEEAATEVAAGAPGEAQRLWRRALALDAGLTLDATYSPSAREAFDEARRAGGTLPPRPSRETLDRLCAVSELAAVLWVASGQDDGGPALVRFLHAPGEPSLGEVRHPLPEEEGERQAVMRSVEVQLGRDLAALAPARPEEGPARPEPRPLWRQWWLWTVLGVAVAGAATATGLALGLGERQVDVEVRFP